ncbi:MAG TPA: hypothetical protein VE081_03980, partial [Sporichthyaceae bacterium]|nr:hypothetical protein [Sporichthyaceae bacterium]
RGCFVYSWDEFATMWVGIFRYLLREPRQPSGRGPVVASVTAGHPSHGTAAFGRIFAGPHLDVRRLPVTMPLPELVDGLNECEPEILFGYPSALHQLTHEAERGRLRIQPRRIIVTAEALLPETRAVIEQTWGVSVGSLYGTSEAGPTGIPCDLGQTHMSEDLVILEPVDAAGRPVPDGSTSATVYLTNLYNRTLPMLRLEVTDEVTVLPGRCPCGSAHRMIADIAGRLDDYFHYGAVSVHPHVFRHALGSRAPIVEYQVRQVPAGADIDVRCVAPLDLVSLTDEIVRALRSLGLGDPLVTIRPVDGLDRGVGGKLKRFIPLVPASCLS